MKYLVIAEKPSVSKSIAKVIGAYRQEDGYLEGGDCVVSWCLGHLAEYAAPEHYDERYENWHFEDLPILPAEWKLLVHSTKKPQFNVLRKLLRSKKFDYVVNACDAGREGEAIFRRVYALAGSKLPIKRLWISSMEDAAIQQGFENLKDGAAYDNLFAASECRAKADWLIGMNGTRAFTKKYGRKQTIGRVQTPTLAMLAERQTKIQNFVKEPYYKVELSGAGVVAVSEQMAQEQDADTVQAACDGQCAVVGSIERKRVEKKPPKLYDLTTLQREANRYYGLTASQTLQALQELYEEKLVTYPRTDSQFVTEDMRKTVESLVLALDGAAADVSCVIRRIPLSVSILPTVLIWSVRFVCRIMRSSAMPTRAWLLTFCSCRSVTVQRWSGLTGWISVKRRRDIPSTSILRSVLRWCWGRSPPKALSMASRKPRSSPSKAQTLPSS